MLAPTLRYLHVMEKTSHATTVETGSIGVVSIRFLGPSVEGMSIRTRFRLDGKTALRLGRCLKVPSL